MSWLQVLAVVSDWYSQCFEAAVGGKWSVFVFFFMESYMLLSVLRDVLLLLLLLLVLFSFHYFWWNRVSLCYTTRVFLNCWSSRVGITPLPQVYVVLGTESAAPCTCALLSYTSGLRSSFSVLLLGLEMTGGSWGSVGQRESPLQLWSSWFWAILLVPFQKHQCWSCWVTVCPTGSRSKRIN